MINLTKYSNRFGRFGLTINNLCHGKGFSLYLGKLFVWHQAWFGRLNQVSWWDGKYCIIFFGHSYSPKQGYKRI